MQLVSPREACTWIQALRERSRVLKFSREALEMRQRNEFRQLAAFVYERSPYYRAIMDQQRIDPRDCVPTDFPILTKREVIDNFDHIVTDLRLSWTRVEQFVEGGQDPIRLLEGGFHVVRSSGTSGTVGYFVYSHLAWIKGTSQMVRALPLGFRTRVAFVGATRGHFAGASLIRTGSYRTNELFYNVLTCDVNEKLPEIVATLNKFQPRALTGYPGVLKLLAESQQNGDLRIKPRMVVSGAEPLRPELRASLERTFGVPVINTYACSEHLFMAITLPGSDGMHLLEDDLIFELHDDYTCVTNLFNDALPLIRYRLDDILAPAPEPLERYPFRKIRDVVGRSEDTLLFRNRDGVEDFIHPVAVVELAVPGLRGWQIAVNGSCSFVFRARMEPGQNREARLATRRRVREKLNAILAEKRMDNVQFRIDEVDSLPPDPVSGKFRFVVKQPAPRFQSVPQLPLAVPSEVSSANI